MTESALLIIDVQNGLDSPSLGERNNPAAEENMTKLLESWRALGAPIIHIKHNSTELNSTLRPELPGNEIKDCVKPAPTEKLIEKSVNSGFIGTDLDEHLKAEGINELVVVGLTTDHCISTTVRMAANLGFKVLLVEDATATFERVSHNGNHISAELMLSLIHI